jgi:hypothetical protein
MLGNGDFLEYGSPRISALAVKAKKETAKKAWCPRRQHQRLLPRFRRRCPPSKPQLKICNDEQSANEYDGQNIIIPRPVHYVKMRPEFLTNVKDLVVQQQSSKNTQHAKTKLQGCFKLPESRQSETSLGKGINCGRIKFFMWKVFKLPRTHN